MVQKLKKKGGGKEVKKESKTNQITGFYNFMISVYIHLARLTLGTCTFLAA